jgi:hypothetical protein
MPGSGRRSRRRRLLAAFLATRHQARSLQRLLHKRVAQLDLVLVPQLLVEVPDVQIKVGFPVQRQHFFHRLQRHPLAAGFSLSPVR